MTYRLQAFDYAVRLPNGQIIGVGTTAEQAHRHANRMACNYKSRAGKQALTRQVSRKTDENGETEWELVNLVEVVPDGR